MLKFQITFILPKVNQYCFYIFVVKTQPNGIKHAFQASFFGNIKFFMESGSILLLKSTLLICPTSIKLKTKVNVGA